MVRCVAVGEACGVMWTHGCGREMWEAVLGCNWVRCGWFRWPESKRQAELVEDRNSLTFSLFFLMLAFFAFLPKF